MGSCWIRIDERPPPVPDNLTDHTPKPRMTTIEVDVWEASPEGQYILGHMMPRQLARHLRKLKEQAEQSVEDGAP